ncbi:MAG: NERD domain-containing protein [Firmicutes bacterium]|nr:NERD domain-containing protein [Bacillota bacterium]
MRAEIRLFITVKGIFVIEGKNYAGYIFGSEKNRNWTVTLYAGKGVFAHENNRRFKYNEKNFIDSYLYLSGFGMPGGLRLRKRPAPAR